MTTPSAPAPSAPAAPASAAQAAPAAPAPATAAPAASPSFEGAASTQHSAPVSAPVSANSLADSVSAPLDLGAQPAPQPAPQPAAPEAAPQAAPDAAKDAAKESAPADTKAGDARAKLGYADVPAAFESAANLAVELGVPSNLLEAAIDIESGKLDASKLGNLSPRDAAILKSEAERCIAEAKARVQSIKADYQKAVGGEAHYNAMMDWARKAAASNPQLKAELADLQPLLKEGGRAGILAARELYSMFTRSEGTAVHASVARAMVEGQEASPTNPRAHLDKGWEMFANRNNK